MNQVRKDCPRGCVFLADFMRKGLEDLYLFSMNPDSVSGGKAPGIIKGQIQKRGSQLDFEEDWRGTMKRIIESQWA